MVFDITSKETRHITKVHASLDLFFMQDMDQKIMNMIHESVFKKEQVFLHSRHMAESQSDYH